jgi:hypothetical protein
VPYVILFGAVVAVFATGCALALRRGAAALRSTHDALRALAAGRGWRLEEGDRHALAFRLHGRSDDCIDWTLRRDASSTAAGEPMTPSVVWSAAARVPAPSLVLAVESRRAHERPGNAALLVGAGELVRRSGWGSGEMPALALRRNGHEVALRDRALRTRHVALTTDDALAAAVLDDEVERLLLGWDADQVSIVVGPDVEVRFHHGALGRAQILALVALGTAVARRERAHAAGLS